MLHHEDGYEKDGQVAPLMLLRSGSAQHHRQTRHERMRRKRRPLGPPEDEPESFDQD